MIGLIEIHPIYKFINCFLNNPQSGLNVNSPVCIPGWNGQEEMQDNKYLVNLNPKGIQHNEVLGFMY